MSVRLKLENRRDGLVATISQRDETGKAIGRPSSFLVGTKEEAKQRAKTLARSLGLKVYGIVDKTGRGEAPHLGSCPGLATLFTSRKPAQTSWSAAFEKGKPCRQLS